MFPLTDAEWEVALWEMVGHLQALIRMDTVNPPGNEISVARYVDDVLRGAGIACRLHEPAPGRGVVVARIRGSGAARPLLLVAHMDVVAVEKEHWTVQPFGGEIVDGYLYGRGAIDDKGMLATNLQAVLLLQRALGARAAPLDRDVIFLATCDEEAGGRHGIRWVLEHVPEVAEAEFALNEGGRIRETEGRRRYCAVQCAEKVPFTLTMTATGRAGHAATPHGDNAVARLAAAVDRVSHHREPVALSDMTRSFLGALAPLWPDPALRGALADVASGDPAAVALGAEALRDHAVLDAMLRNTVCPTMLAAGVKSNVIPATATATFNARLLPGSRIDEVIARLDDAIGDRQVGLSIRSSGTEAAPSPPESPMFAAVAAAVRALDPEIRTVPFVSPGATDSSALRRAGVACYGLLPFPLTEEDEGRMHGHDERVAVSALGFGLRLLTGVIERAGRAT